MLVLHPARTVLEKLVHVHELAVRLAADDDLQPDRRSGRHFYDIHELLGDGRVLDLLADRDETLQVSRSIDEITHTYFGGAEGVSVRPDGGFATSPAFDPATSASARLRVAYDTTMPALYFGTGALSTWEQICERVADRAELL